MRRALAGLFGFATWLAASAASAEVVGRLDAEAMLVIDTAAPSTLLAGGGGGELLFGYSFELYPVVLVAELGGSFHAAGGDATYLIPRAVGGVRVGAALAVEPSLAVHFGYGNRHTTVTTPLGDVSASAHAFTFDTELRLDVRLERELTIGPQVQYNLLVATDDGSQLHGVSLGGGAAWWW